MNLNASSMSESLSITLPLKWKKFVFILTQYCGKKILISKWHMQLSEEPDRIIPTCFSNSSGVIVKI